jgi:hypothetical protein
MSTAGPRLELLDAARIAVEDAAAAGNVLAATFEASRLFREYPSGRMSVAEIKAELERLAAARGVAILGKST